GGLAKAAPDRVSPGSGATISLSNYIGTIQKWQWSQNAVDWIDLAGSGELNPLVVAELNVTTLYRAVVQSGSCAPEISAPATVNVDTQVCSVSVAPLGSPTICNGDSVTLTASGASTYNWSPSVG